MTTKEEIVKIVQDLPDDSSVEEIIREILFAEIIKRGLNDSENNRILTTSQLKERVKQWRK